MLQDTCGRNLINYFTVILAAHASFVQVPVRGHRAEPLIHEPYRHLGSAVP